MDVGSGGNLDSLRQATAGSLRGHSVVLWVPFEAYIAPVLELARFGEADTLY